MIKKYRVTHIHSPGGYFETGIEAHAFAKALSHESAGITHVQKLGPVVYETTASYMNGAEASNPDARQAQSQALAEESVRPNHGGQQNV